MSATKSSDQDIYPIGAVVGSSGSGKTQILAYSAFQYSLEGRPVIVIDPKKGSDFSAAFGDACINLLTRLLCRLLRRARRIRWHRGVRPAAFLEDPR